MQNNTSVLGENWFLTFSQFRLNPEYFFDRRKLTREAFCLDVLRDIYLDHIDVQCKIHILLLLQEHSTTLIKDFNLLEQICGSLMNLFNILKKDNGNRIIRNQILICITTILLSVDLEHETEELISSIKKLLLNILFSKSEDFVVISAACKCLEEIEVCFPTSLEPEVKNIFKSCEDHLSSAFQNYATLLSLCMKNMCIKTSDRNVLENESLKEMPNCTKNEIQLSNLVSYLIQLIPLMSPMCVYRVLKNLIPVVKHSSGISPMVFKLFLPNLIFSSEVQYFNLAFDFLLNFHLDLFTVQEEKCLLRQLMLLSSHPCLSLSHRMLFMDWLKSCILNKQLISSQFLKSLLPGPFDGPITQEKKSCLLSFYISHNVDKNLSVDLLDEAISGLKKCALLPNGTKAAASFFRTLFIYFSHHRHELIHNYMYKLLLGIMKTSPHLLQYVLSFINAVKVKIPESPFPKEALAHMVDHILSLPMKQFTSNLECYLAILEQASEICGSESKPKSILHLLQKLLTDSISSEKNTWEFGNSILSVCRSILLYHDLQIFYFDLAEVLCLISQSIDDVDVKDRAKIYYSVLTTLSKLKIQSVFKMKTPKRDMKSSLTSFVPGVTKNFQFVPCIQVLTKPVLELIRIKKTWTLPEENTTDYLLPDIDILETYKNYLDTNDSVVKLPFLLKHISDPEVTFNSLYGVVISTESSPPCKEISVIEIPVYKNSKPTSEENVFFIEFLPFESCPTELFFKAEFTSSNGQNYICNPDPVFLNFKDFFLTLPVPESLKDCSYVWKKNLFETLWKEFEKEALESEKMKCKSAICLKISKEELFMIIEENLKQFIVAKFDEFKFWIAIFLPPKSHWLMKIDIINEKPFINIIVDDISILPWAALYLQEVTKC